MKYYAKKLNINGEIFAAYQSDKPFQYDSKLLPCTKSEYRNFHDKNKLNAKEKPYLPIIRKHTLIDIHQEDLEGTGLIREIDNKNTSIENLKKAKTIYYYDYLVDLYNLIHTGGATWEFFDVNDYTIYNDTNLPHNFYMAGNPYLNSYKDDKTGLAKELIEYGMLFPFVGSKENKQLNLYLGKHRLYSILLLNQIQPVHHKFLYISVPDDETLLENLKGKSSSYFLLNNKFKKDAIKPNLNAYIYTRQKVYNIFDVAGTWISEIFFNYKEQYAHPILNNEELFKQFIEAPLDKNNIMYKYLEKEAE